MNKPIILNKTLTEVSIDSGKLYRISGYGFVSCWFTYLENLEVPLFCGDFNAPSGVKITCEDGDLKIHCDNPQMYNSVVLESRPYTGGGFVNHSTIDLSLAESVTIIAKTGGAAYQLAGPFTAEYNAITGTDSAHNYETATSLNVVAVQIGAVTYPCSGSGTQTGNAYTLERFIPAYVA